MGEIERVLTLRTSSLARPSAGRRAPRLRRRTVSMTALAAGRPTVTAMVLVRYMKEMAGAVCDGPTTAWSEMKTALWATPVPKPLACRVSNY